MFNRRTTGSVVCPACGSLVGVKDERCYTCGRANPGLWGFGPMLRQLGSDMGFVPLVMTGSVVMFLLSLLLSHGDVSPLLGPSGDALFLLGASGAYPVFIGNQWWTVLSATWLHANAVHIVFNMMAARSFGPATAEMIGPARTVIIYTVSGVTGFLLSSVLARYIYLPIPFFHGSAFVVGASASICGLLGALLHYGQRSGSSFIVSQIRFYALWFLISGVILPNVDNAAHVGGFLGGYATSWFFNPLTRERGDHMIVAALCLAATVLAVIASVVVGLSR
jgi:rhomboid protease GluP